MIDIHTHILPYVDDGSPDLETSVALIKSEIEQGVTDIFVTPHYYKYRGFLSTQKENKEIFENLKKEVNIQRLKVNLYLGNEIYYDSHTMKLIADGTVASLADSKYVLVEFSMLNEDEDICEAINNLTAKGYIPIIAHPERYPYLNEVNHFKIMKKMGAKVQINSGSLTGYYGRKAKKMVIKLIKEELVDFVASDVHDFRHGQFSSGYQVVQKVFSTEIADKLFANKCIFE